MSVPNALKTERAKILKAHKVLMEYNEIPLGRLQVKLVYGSKSFTAKESLVTQNTGIGYVLAFLHLAVKLGLTVEDVKRLIDEVESIEEHEAI